MQRREFLASTCVTGAGALAAMAGAAGAAEGAPAKKQVLELRLYKLDEGDQWQQFEKFLAEAAIPAWNRLGVKPIGVFASKDEKLKGLFVLLPHDSADAFLAASQKIWADADYQKAGASLLETPKDKPPYVRIATWLMLAFDGCPKVETPTKKDTRIFQLRTYESHCDGRAKKKVEMFNTGGEIALFRKVGMTPVFFGETVAGGMMPNLTYMLGFEDEAAQKAGWDKFMASDEWKKLKDAPEYKDTVSNITNIVMKPAACSQI